MRNSWRIALRDGVFPNLSTPGLLALARALAADDARLLQGATTAPAPLQCVRDWPCEAADFIGFSFWQGDARGQATVCDVEEFFARVCFEADRLLGEPAACRYWINFWDESPRAEVLPLALDEARRELRLRRTPEEVIAAVAAGEAV